MPLDWVCTGCGARYYGETAAAGCCADGEAVRTPSGRRYPGDPRPMDNDERDPSTNEYAAHDAMRRRAYRLQGRSSGGRRL